MEDHAGIAQLVEMYASMIYRIAYTRMQNVADAEDITQEVLLKYLKADKTFRDEEHRKMWLIRVTVNTIKSNVTSAWRRHTVALDDVTEPSYEDTRKGNFRLESNPAPNGWFCLLGRSSPTGCPFSYATGRHHSAGFP